MFNLITLNYFFSRGLVLPAIHFTSIYRITALPILPFIPRAKDFTNGSAADAPNLRQLFTVVPNNLDMSLTTSADLLTQDADLHGADRVTQ